MALASNNVSSSNNRLMSSRLLFVLDEYTRLLQNSGVASTESALQHALHCRSSLRPEEFTHGGIQKQRLGKLQTLAQQSFDAVQAIFLMQLAGTVDFATLGGTGRPCPPKVLICSFIPTVPCIGSLRSNVLCR